MQLLRSAITLALLVAWAAAYGEFLSVKWETCSVDSKGMYTKNFWPVSRCMPMSELQPGESLAPNKTVCDVTYNAAQFEIGNTGKYNCSDLAAAATQAYWCSAANRITPVNTTQLDAIIETQDTCADGPKAFILLYNTRDFIAKEASAHKLRLQCKNKKVSFAPCLEGDNTNITDAFPQFGGGECRDGLEMHCDYCQPYMEETSVAQPYYFLIFPGLKMICVVMLKLFVFDTVSNTVRRRVERFERERPPPVADLDEEFTKYVIEQVLSNGEFRIRLRLTLRNLNGRWALKKMLKHFNNDRHQLTQEERDEILADKALACQKALLDRETVVSNYRFVMSQVLEGVRLTDDQENAVRAEEEWFWSTVSDNGERIYNGSLDDLNTLFRKNWTLHTTPQLHMYDEHGTDNADDDVIIVLREVGNEEDQEKHELYLHVEYTMFCSDMMDYLERMLKQVHPEYEYEDRCTLYYRDGRPVKMGDTKTVHDIMKNRPPEYQGHKTIVLRYTLDEKPPKSIDPHHFVSIVEKIDDNHADFMATATFEMARFEYDPLFSETHITISKVLDKRTKSAICEQLLLMAGDEVIFDYEIKNQYKYRDDIPQLKKRGADGLTKKERKKKKKKAEKAENGEEEEKKDDDTIPCFEWFFKIDESEMPSSPMSPQPTEPFASDSADLTASPSQAGDLVSSPTNVFVAMEKNFVVPVATPEVAVLTVSDDCSIFKGSKVSHQVQKSKVIELYNKAFRFLALKEDYTGIKKEGVMKAFKKDRVKLRTALTEMYNVVESRLAAANNDTNMVFVEGIAEEFKEKVDSYSRIVPIVSKESQVFATIYQINVYILLMQVLYAIVFFGFCVDDGLNLSPSDASGWRVYELIYFRFLNSGTPVSVLTAALSNLASGAENRANSYFFKVMDYTLFAMAMLLIGPAICTHLIPALFVYCWVFFAAVVIFFTPSAILLAIFGKYHNKWTDPAQGYTTSEIAENHQLLKMILTVLALWFQFCLIILMTGVFQSTFNWAHLFYGRDEFDLDYGGILQYEWDSRSPACYFQEALVSPANALQMLSSFIG